MISVAPSSPVPPNDLANNRPPEKFNLTKKISVDPLEDKFVVVFPGLKSTVPSKVPVTNKNPNASMAKLSGLSLSEPPIVCTLKKLPKKLSFST